jgi:hypothetical protein
VGSRRFNAEDVDRIASQPGYALGHAAFHPHGAQPSAVLERRDADAPSQTHQAQKINPGRLRVIVKSFRLRLLDEDNLAEKFHVDALRYAQVIPEDSPDKVSIIATQEKVKTETEERTEITIERI